MIFIHGNDTLHWAHAYAPWLKNELEALGFETIFETFPDSIIARAQYWLPFLKDILKVTENDVLIGSSSGAVASLRFAESNKIKGSILISPCYTDLNDPLEKQSGYYDKPWNWQAIKANQTNIALVYGDEDPYIPQEEFEYIATQLEPSVLKLKNSKHFQDVTEIPELLKYIQKTYK